jgi:HPt (histidine-containing phosphotransfer) domain-containing protein
MIRALVLCADAEWAQRSGLLAMLAAFGMAARVCTEPAQAQAGLAGSQLLLVGPGDFSLPDAGSHCLVLPVPRSGTTGATGGEVAHAALSVAGLARALTAHGFALVSPPERRALLRLVPSLPGAGTSRRALADYLARAMTADLQAMQRACEASDWPGLAGLAHRFKGAGGIFGCAGITALASLLEAAAVQADAATAGALLPLFALTAQRFAQAAEPDFARVPGLAGHDVHGI